MGCGIINNCHPFQMNNLDNPIYKTNQTEINNKREENQTINNEIINKEKKENKNEKESNENDIKLKINNKIENDNQEIKQTAENEIIKLKYNNKITKAEISEEDKKKIQISLQYHFLFKNINESIISNIIELLQMQKLQPNITLFNKGDKGNYFYIIKKGKLELIAEYGKKILNQDETFGELALIENKARTATVKSIDYCILYLINGKLFRETVSQINEGELLERLNFLKAISIFNVLDNVHLNSIALGMLKCEFDKGQTILYEGDVGQSIYIIKYGKVKCFKGEKEVRFLGPRDFFGESAVLFNTNRSLSVLVEEKSVCYQISESLLIDIIGEEYKNIIIYSISKVSIRKSQYMKILANEMFFNKILENCVLKTFDNKALVYDIKNPNGFNKFYIIISGNFIKESTGEILASRIQLYGDILKTSKREVSLQDAIQTAQEFATESTVPGTSVQPITAADVQVDKNTGVVTVTVIEDFSSVELDFDETGG